MKRLILSIALAVSTMGFAQELVHEPVQQFQTVQYQNKREAFVNNLLSKMTLEEKLGQLNLPSAGDFTTGAMQNSNIGKKIQEGQVGGVFNITGIDKIRALQKTAVEKSRLKIPLIIGMDVIHGYRTTFPIPLGLASSWDMDLIQKSARIAAQESTAGGINWVYSPMVDVARDARWGRVAEGAGEDPYLGGEIAKAMIYGYQGKDLAANNTVIACVKHFALYGASEAGRDYNTVDMSHLTMFNDYFKPYKVAVDAGVGSVMTSFNTVDYIPATGNKWLLTDVLRKDWGFKGFVVSDYTSVNEMTAHGMGDLQQVSALALNAGLDMDMVGEGFLTTLKKSLDEGKVKIGSIDAAVRNILNAKYDLGLFKDPYLYINDKRSKTEISTPANLEAARNIAAQSMVLLKNDHQLLPLKPTGTIAVIGPLADNKLNMAGTWSVGADQNQSVSILDGLKQSYPKVNFVYAKGSNVYESEEMEDRATMFGKSAGRDSRPADVIRQEAVNVAQQADVIILQLGETAEMSGESSSRTRIDVPKTQRDLLAALKQTGKPIVLVLTTGRPLVLNEENKEADAILNIWFPGTEAGLAVSDVLFGKVNPSAKLPMSFPRAVGQVPIYYNHLNTGRPLSPEMTEKCQWQKFVSDYLDQCNTPLFPFGYGLSYTTFKYSPMSLSKTNLKGNEVLKASVNVTNTGKYDGSEVVQMYIRDMVASISRPVQELKGFQKISLKAGETKTVTFEITPEDLKFYNSQLKYDWEPGQFDIMIGTNSAEVQHQKVDWEK